MREPLWDSAPAPGEAPAGSASETVETWPCSWCRSYRSSAALPLERPLRPASAPGRALARLRLRVRSWDWLHTPRPPGWRRGAGAAGVALMGELSLVLEGAGAGLADARPGLGLISLPLAASPVLSLAP